MIGQVTAGSSPDCYGPSPPWDEVRVLLLDFDLSWHLDAFDVSVSQPGAANGYLAPEQVERSASVSTRNAAVDSFGLGMTFYFLRAGRDPRFGENRYSDWLSTLAELARGNPCKQWRSLPHRYSRLIFNSTRNRQEERLDVVLIEAELLRLLEAESNPSAVLSAEMLAEEIAMRASDGNYKWNNDNFSARHEVGGARIDVKGIESTRTVQVEFQWLKAGFEHHQNVRKWLPVAQGKIESAFRQSGWHVQAGLDTGVLRGHAEADVDLIRRNVEGAATTLAAVIDALGFQ